MKKKSLPQVSDENKKLGDDVKKLNIDIDKVMQQDYWEQDVYKSSIVPLLPTAQKYGLISKNTMKSAIKYQMNPKSITADEYSTLKYSVNTMLATMKRAFDALL